MISEFKEFLNESTNLIVKKDKEELLLQIQELEFYQMKLQEKLNFTKQDTGKMKDMITSSLVSMKFIGLGAICIVLLESNPIGWVLTGSCFILALCFAARTIKKSNEKSKIEECSE